MLTAFQNFLYSCAISFDLPILDWIQAHLQSGFMDKFMPFITKFGDHGLFWMIVAAVLFIIPKTRKTGLGMAIAMMIGLLVCNVTLKPLVGRIRPYDLQAELGVTIQLLGVVYQRKMNKMPAPDAVEEKPVEEIIELM